MPIFIAPCGHHGEPVIGTYVRCPYGCDSGNPRPRWGMPPVAGHKLDCTCAECCVRRDARAVRLKYKDGRTHTLGRVHAATVGPAGPELTGGCPSGFIVELQLLDRHDVMIINELIQVHVLGEITIRLDKLVIKGMAARK